MTNMVKPHGGVLLERVLAPDEELALLRRAGRLEAVVLDDQELHDLELHRLGRGASVHV
jgi:hypothetical protein